MKAELVTAADNDLKIANSARVSFNKESKEFTYRKDKPKGSDEGIIDFLARDNHFTPFTHVRDTFEIFDNYYPLVNLNYLNPELITGMVWNRDLTKIRHSLYGWAQLLKGGYVNAGFANSIAENLRIKYPVAAERLGITEEAFLSLPFDGIAYHRENDDDPWFVDVTMRETIPIFVARQRFKHTVGFSYNEVSRRYVDDPPEYYFPDAWRKRAEDKKQGSSDEIITGKFASWGDSDPWSLYESFVDERTIEEWYKAWIEDADFNYKKLLEWEVAPEQARMILPQSMLTSYYVTGSLTAWKRAYKLRVDSHAQKEINFLSEQWDALISEVHGVDWRKT